MLTRLKSRDITRDILVIILLGALEVHCKKPHVFWHGQSFWFWRSTIRRVLDDRWIWIRASGMEHVSVDGQACPNVAPGMSRGMEEFAVTHPMRILFISFFFPPYNAIGCVRTGKTAKYLMRFGHDVRVISAREQNLH